MTLHIDKATSTLTIDRQGAPHRCAIMDVRITTDPQVRMSELHVDGFSMHIPEEDAEHLIALGARDDRKNLIFDE